MRKQLVLSTGIQNYRYLKATEALVIPVILPPLCPSKLLPIQASAGMGGARGPILPSTPKSVIRIPVSSFHATKLATTEAIFR